MKEKLTKGWLTRDNDGSLWWFLRNPDWFDEIGKWLLAPGEDGNSWFYVEPTNYTFSFKLPKPGKKVAMWIEL